MNYWNYALNSPVYVSLEETPGMTILICLVSVVSSSKCSVFLPKRPGAGDLKKGKKVRNADMMLLQQRKYFLGAFCVIWLGGLRLRGWQNVLNARYLCFGKTRKNPPTAMLITDQSFPSQNFSFLQKETFFTFCCSSCPDVAFLDAQMGWFSSGPLWQQQTVKWNLSWTIRSSWGTALSWRQNRNCLSF